MFCICVLIIAAAAVYMVEAYIHTYYAIEYMHGAPLFFVLLAKYAAPVLFLLLCGYFVFRYSEKRRESEKPAQDKPMNREEVYAEKINATLTPPTIEIVGFPGGGGKAYHHAAYKAASYAVSHHPLRV